jgi:hypothetical protein
MEGLEAVVLGSTVPLDDIKIIAKVCAEKLRLRRVVAIVKVRSAFENTVVGLY